MADEKRTTPGEGARHRRAAPTIDLKASEVKPEGETPPPEQTRPAYEQTEAGPTRDFLAAATGERQSGEAPAGSAPRWKISHAMAGIAGGALVVVFLFGLWLSGMVPIRYAGATAMRARVSLLEMQLQDLSNRPAPALDTKSLDPLKDRLDKIELALAKIPAADPAIGERLGAIENGMKALGIALTALNHRAEEVAGTIAAAQERATRAEKTATDLQSRIAAFEQNTKVAQEKAVKSADTATRLALAAIALRNAVARNEPYRAELAEVKNLGGDEAAIAALAPFASSAIPADAALTRELTALLPAMLEAAGANAAQSGGFFERLQANAGKLVRIQPVEAPPGDDPAAILARIEIKAARADVAGVRAELAKLPAKAQIPAADWIRKADAREAAIAASRKLAADSSRALGKSIESP